MPRFSLYCSRRSLEMGVLLNPLVSSATYYRLMGQKYKKENKRS